MCGKLSSYFQFLQSNRMFGLNVVQYVMNIFTLIYYLTLFSGPNMYCIVGVCLLRVSRVSIGGGFR